MRLIDLTGEEFGKLLVLYRSPKNLAGGKHVAWQCLCSCGGQTVVTTAHLRSGHTTSCGCHKAVAAGLHAVTHGLTRGKRGRKLSREYTTWLQMRRRCTSPRAQEYANYGGRGITVCPRWANDFAAFLADMGPRPKGASIDRIDNDGPYSPENCRWATRLQQANNTRRNIRYEFNGQSLSLKQIAREAGVSYIPLWKRVRRRGMSVHAALAGMS